MAHHVSILRGKCSFREKRGLKFGDYSVATQRTIGVKVIVTSDGALGFGSFFFRSIHASMLFVH